MAISRGESSGPYGSVLGSVAIPEKGSGYHAASKVDIHSQAWKMVSLNAEVSIQSAQKELESFDCTPERTQYLRGQIAAYRKILNLGI